MSADRASETAAVTDAAPPLRAIVQASLFAALTAVGAYIAIPVGPVPIVLQNLFVFLAGLLLGPRWGLASVAIYLLAGICGLPVFGGVGRDVAAMVLGAAALYACGVPWLAAVTGLPFGKALVVGVLPFLPGDAVKIAAAALIARSVRPLMPH